MLKSRKLAIVAFAVCIVGLSVWRLTAGGPTITEQRSNATKAYNDGNYKAAYEGLRKLALDPKNDPALVGKDLELAIHSLTNLGRNEEVDAFREAVIKAHEKNWRLLATAAKTYASGEHFGFIVAGEFKRGGHRGGGTLFNCLQRDRTRALQLMQQALDNTKNENDKSALAEFHLEFANMILQGAGYSDAWRLQYLTDLSKLPDYEEGWWWHRNRNHVGAPVDDKGNPILHKVAKTWKDAASDGERWRWLLTQAMELDSGRTNEVDIIFADFMKSQLGVQTMAYYGWRFGGIGENEDNKDKTGTFALHTLKENETIARLATGLKRLDVPDEFNWIKIYTRVADRAQTAWGARALDNLGSEFEDRRQYPRSAEWWKRAIKEYGPGGDQNRQKRLDQIVGNWGRFENVQTQLADKEALLDFRYRNGNKVAFEAHEIDVPKLLDDVKAYLRSNPGNRLDYNQLNIHNIGHRLVFEGQTQYLKGKVHEWKVDVKPRPAHVDDRVTVKAPKLKPGAYLITGQMADGNLSRIVLWVNDTVIVKKMLDNQSFYFVADAMTGAPLEKVDVEFFGWRQEQVVPNQNNYRIVTTKHEAKTDADGQIILGQDKLPPSYQWLVTATSPRPAAGEGPGVRGTRHAYLGFTGVWYQRRHDHEYNMTRGFVITDRPVYRPDNSVQFKAWIQHSKYDQPDVSSFAGKAFKVRIHDPKGEKMASMLSQCSL
jgi:hypothetical protein